MFKRFVILIGCLLFVTGVAFAQDNTAKATDNESVKKEAEATATKKEDEKLIPGVIASFGKQKHQASVNVNSTIASGDTPSPISASVSRVKSNQCMATVKNQSTDSSYSVSFNVEGYTSSGSKAMSKSYSATLAPNQSVDKIVSCEKGLNMQVLLKSGKKVGK